MIERPGLVIRCDTAVEQLKVDIAHYEPEIKRLEAELAEAESKITALQHTIQDIKAVCVEPDEAMEALAEARRETAQEIFEQMELERIDDNPCYALPPFAVDALKDKYGLPEEEKPEARP